MMRTAGIRAFLSLCSLAALPACTVNAPRTSGTYAAPAGIAATQPQYGTYVAPYAPAEATAAPYAAMPASGGSVTAPQEVARETWATQGSPLVVHDLTTRKIMVDGEKRLMIEGDIVNVSPVRQTAAQLYGKVLDSQDTVLRNLPMPNWSPVVVLPGASLHFRIDTPVPPPPAARVRVTVGT